MAVYPMEQRMYMLEDTTIWPLNVTFLPHHPRGGTVTNWMDNWAPDISFIYTLRNMSLASLAMLALLEVPESTNKFLSQLRRLLVRWGFYHVVLINLMKTVVGVAFMVWSLPVMLPFMAIFYVTSFLAKVLCALRWGTRASKAQGLDCLWGVKDQENQPFITACLLVRGAPSLHWIQHVLLTKVVQVRNGDGEYKYRKFRQLFSQHCGYYCWRDDPHFDIRNHVRLVKLNHTASEATVENDLDSASAGDKEEQEDRGEAQEDRSVAQENRSEAQEDRGEAKEDRSVAQENRSEAQEDRSEAQEDRGEAQEDRSEAEDELVQQYVSEELTEDMPENMAPWEVLLVARKDGRYNVVLRIHHAIGDGVTLVRLCVEALVDTPLPRPPVGAPPPSPLVKAAGIMWSLTMLPFGIMKLVANFDRSCLHGPPLSGRKVMTWSKGMPLSVIREVRRAAPGTTVNDVLMTCLSASLDKHFTRRKEEGVQKVTAVVPVSFHDRHERLTLTNLFSVAVIKLPVASALKTSARLAAVKDVLDAMKKDPTLWAMYFVVKAASEIMPAPLAAYMFCSSGITLAASNVPGPQQEISIWGDKVEDLVFWVPNRTPVGVGVSFFSYMGVVKVGLNVDLALVDSKAEAHQLLEDMEDELRLLHSRLLPQAA
ncbi:uncharacterized protein LOC126986859 [Eriocheir sinensis]|uniref:uncharacterized protein LOC126986859 n=1 Tax=Eriocheir sinensis TaxID=95602 RepID=UPI0021CA3C1D|nr:uncharacterized protein LOC126986859 [Eriocheir sinensis]XP_050699269.1 uncharacterized protein LOC126986859 [Eriocheir sinensis]